MSRKNTRLEDLAARAGVSISTASRALNDHPAVSKRTKQEIWRIALEMNYPFRRSMPAGPIGADAVLSVVVPRPQARDVGRADPFLNELIAGIGAAARERDCDILLSHVSPQSYDDLEEAMSTGRANGVIFLGQSVLHGAFNKLSENHSNFIVWGAELPDQDYCCIGSDNHLGGRRATLHLARLGRKRIAFLGDTAAIEALQRYRGYLEALSIAKLPHDPALVVPVHFEIASAESAVHALLSQGVAFDGVVAASDLIALGVMRALRQTGRAVPEHVSVIGYDDVAFARLGAPSLSTIGQDAGLAGRLMVSKLLDGGAGAIGPSERLATDLIVRESCGG
jgi:DNA-binding LacI/PurR family transcriptional regulator